MAEGKEKGCKAQGNNSCLSDMILTISRKTVGAQSFAPDSMDTSIPQF
jgi:hypothetical protein